MIILAHDCLSGGYGYDDDITTATHSRNGKIGCLILSCGFSSEQFTILQLGVKFRLVSVLGSVYAVESED
jgi:hypothetical protein